MSNLTVRTLSAIVLTLGGFAALLLNVHSRWIAIALIIIIGSWELSRLVDRKFGSPHLAWFSALSAFGFSLTYFPGLALPEYWIWIVSILSLVGYVLLGFRHLDIELMAPWILMNGFICAYMGLWATRLFALMGPELGWAGILPLAFTIICVAVEDIGAYAAGRMWGRRKLAPSISSKKTVAGTIGGTVAGMVAAGI